MPDSMIREEVTGIVKVTGQCDMVNQADVDPGSLTDYDLVGLGCPVFYFQEPFNIRDFIERLPILKDRQWFIFCTHGSVLGNTLRSMAERLQKKGIPAGKLDSVHAPIGIEIGADTPEEIAISILAEVIKVRRSVSKDDNQE